MAKAIDGRIRSILEELTIEGKFLFRASDNPTVWAISAHTGRDKWVTHAQFLRMSLYGMIGDTNGKGRYEITELGREALAYKPKRRKRKTT